MSGARRGKGPGQSAGVLPVVAGLVIAVALTLGIWTAFFLFAGDDQAVSPSRDVARLDAEVDAPATEAAPGAATLSPPADEASEEGDTAAPNTTRNRADGSGEPAAEPPAATGAESTIARADPLNRPVAASEAGRYAAPGVEPTAPDHPAPPGTDQMGNLRIDPQDPALRDQDRIAALPAPGAGPERPAPLRPAIPPPAGEDEGTGTDDRTAPEGVQVTAGAPPQRPPAAPGRSDPSAPATEAEPEIPVTAGLPPAMPPPRPAGLPGADEAALETDIAAAPPSGAPAARVVATQETDAAVEAALASHIAALAPRPRPAAPSPPGAAGADTDTGSTEAADTDGAVALALSDPPAVNPHAVLRSLAPRRRPADLDSGSTGQAARLTTPDAPAAPHPATTEAAFAPGRVDLIGIYGSEANRRALVRLPDGRFVKVEVGDRVDGGQIRAISGSDLSYVKSGRTIILTMPSG